MRCATEISAGQAGGIEWGGSDRSPKPKNPRGEPAGFEVLGWLVPEKQRVQEPIIGNRQRDKCNFLGRRKMHRVFVRPCLAHL